MRSRLETDGKRVERCEILHPRDIRTDDCLLVFRDHASALGFLRRLSADTMTMQALRGALAEADAAPVLHRAMDREVLDQLAWRLAAGWLRIAVTLRDRPTGGNSVEATSAPPSMPARSSQSSPPPPREAPVPPPADPLLDSMDVVAQAETLRESARNGIPFCEECTKTRRAG